jgi:hypothetical protein
MIIRKRISDPKLVLRLGCVFLIVASLSRWFLHPSTRFSEGFVDGATGFLYGIAIATLLLAIRLNARRRSTSPGGCGS